MHISIHSGKGLIKVLKVIILTTVMNNNSELQEIEKGYQKLL